MSHRKHVLCLIVAGAAAVCSGAAAAAEVVGRVLLAAGDTFAVRDGKEVRLAFNSPIEFKDVLRTGAASSLQVRFVDDGLLSIRDNSEFAIEDYQFGAKPDEQRSFFRLIKGGFRAVTGLIGRTQHANYRVRAENATIGIRGTDYAVRQCAGDCGAGVKDGLYGSVLGISNGTNQITLTNNAGESTFGINQHFFVASANTLPQPLLQPPSFVSFTPQGKGQATQQGGSGSGEEHATGSSGVSGESRPQSVVETVTPTIAPITNTTQYTVTNTVTTGGTTALVPGFTLGGLGVVPGQGTGTQNGGDDGGGAFITLSMLTLNASGIPTAINIPSGCIGPNNNCNDGFQATGLGTPVEAGSAAPDGATNQKIFWGRWQSGTVNNGGSGPEALSSAVNAHFMYGTLTPADVLAAKTGTLTLMSSFPGGFGTTPTNNFGATPSSGVMPIISVNFTSRVASITPSALVFGSGTGPQDQVWALPAGSGPITIVPGSGGFFQIQGQGTNGSGGWACAGSGCAGATTISGKAAGIFFGPVGDHAGVTLSGSATNSSGVNVGNFGTIRVFCTSGC